MPKGVDWLVCVAVIAAVSCGGSNHTPPHAEPPAGTTGTARRVAPGTNPEPDDSGDWTRPAKDYASTRYTALDQITTESVEQLGVKGTFSTGVVGGHEAAPIVVNDTMYIVTPWPNIL